MRVAAASRGVLTRRMSAGPMPTGRGLLPLADVADRQRRDGGPELVIGRKDAFGCAHVQVHVVVERRAEAVQEGG